jgi:phosphoglycolate phosphatase-like HAD superfamily hydrolase
MSIRAIFWDFGGTLADENWMLAPLAGDEAWPELYRDVLGSNRLRQRWSDGEASTADVVQALALRSGKPRGAILTHMQACCRNLNFYPEVVRLVERTSLPQALVTVNSDIFTEVVAPHYDLSRRFELIVTSWQERLSDKGLLCEIARLWLDPNLRAAECLLVDNLQANIDAWAARGGAGLRFISEDDLLRAWPVSTGTSS